MEERSCPGDLRRFYYLVFIGFGEEFLCRDVCTDFLWEASPPVRYLVPNLCFAMLHLFARTGWGVIAKEKSGSLWLPVLLHALMDYSVVLTY